MTVLSLFDGISAGRVALERAGIKVNRYYASEIDKYAIQVAQKNYPDTVQLGNVFDVDFKSLGHIDLVIGGFPCTTFSIARKDRETSIEGDGGKLFLECIRALNETGAKYFMFENNYSIHKDVKDAVTELTGVDFIMINSALVSAQQRKRCYWTNIPNISQPGDRGVKLKDVIDGGITERDKAFCIDASYWKGGNINNHLVKHRRTQTSQPVRVGHIGKGGQGQRIYSVDGKSINLTANGGGQGAKTGLYRLNLPDGSYYIRKLTPIECERLQTFPDDYTEKGLDIHFLNIYNKVNEMNGGEIKCKNVKLTDAKTQYQTEAQDCAISTILDLRDMEQLSLQEKQLINLSNVQLKAVKGLDKQQLDCVSCTIKDIKDMELLNSQLQKLKNANFAMKIQLQEECVISTIKTGLDTETLNIPIKSRTEIINMDTKNLKGNIELNIEKLLKKFLEENFEKEKLCIILTLINLITMKVICMFATTHQNIQASINNLTVSQENLLSWDISDLRTEVTTSISNTQRYKCLGNSWTVDVIAHIFRHITEANT